MITIILMYAVLSLTFIVAKKTLFYADPYFIIGFRMILAGGLFLSLQYLFDRKNFCVKRNDVWLFLKTALFYIYLAFIPEFWALQKLSASKVTIIYSITPFIVAILAYFIASETLTRKKVIGMLIGFGGIIPILMSPDMNTNASELLSVSAREGSLLLAVFAGAYGWFPIKKLMKRGYKLPMINGITMLIGGIGAMITSFSIEGICVAHVSSWPQFLFWIMLLIIIANGIFYHMYGWHLRKYSFIVLSFTGFLCPIFGSFFGWLLLGEQITIHHFLSLLIIGAGLFLFYTDELQKQS
jgi:drug/metabolite transporter (DMT)-like permease